MDIREYAPKKLPYHFILFYNIPENRLRSLYGMFGYKYGDNALLTYCYLDSQCGLSYEVVCCARVFYDKGRFETHEPEVRNTAMRLREGSLECDAIILEDDDRVSRRYQDVADRIKENYGYYVDKVTVHPAIPFDAYRHPAYLSDIYTYFYTPQNNGMERMWIREISRDGDEVLGRLLDNPYNELVELRQGDTVRIIPHKEDDEVLPFAFLPWMEEL